MCCSSAVCEYRRGNDSNEAVQREVRIFFEQVYQEVHVSKSGCVATAHEKTDKKS